MKIKNLVGGLLAVCIFGGALTIRAAAPKVAADVVNDKPKSDGRAGGEKEAEDDAAMKGIGGGGRMPGAGAGTDKEYERDSQYNRWSR